MMSCAQFRHYVTEKSAAYIQVTQYCQDREICDAEVLIREMLDVTW